MANFQILKLYSIVFVHIELAIRKTGFLNIIILRVISPFFTPLPFRQCVRNQYYLIKQRTLFKQHGKVLNVCLKINPKLKISNGHSQHTDNHIHAHTHTHKHTHPYTHTHT